jgi:hypothetical protein
MNHFYHRHLILSICYINSLLILTIVHSNINSFSLYRPTIYQSVVTPITSTTADKIFPQLPHTSTLSLRTVGCCGRCVCPDELIYITAKLLYS